MHGATREGPQQRLAVHEHAPADARDARKLAALDQAVDGLAGRSEKLGGLGDRHERRFSFLQHVILQASRVGGAHPVPGGVDQEATSARVVAAPVRPALTVCVDVDGAARHARASMASPTASKSATTRRWIRAGTGECPPVSAFVARRSALPSARACAASHADLFDPDSTVGVDHGPDRHVVGQKVEDGPMSALERGRASRLTL